MREGVVQKNSLRKISRVILGSAFACSALLFADKVMADPAQATDGVASQGAQNSASSSNGVIEQVIVTARKRAEREQDVPVAMSTMTAQDIHRYHVDTFEQLSALTPGLVISDAPSTGGGLLYLRGIGAGANAPSVDQAVTTDIDGVPFSQALALRVGEMDLDQIAVLKGPQALFFGQNSPGGVISLTSANPTDQFEARLTGGYEFYNQQEYGEAMVSGPLTDTLFGRVVYYDSWQNGWLHNVADYNDPGETNPSVRTAPMEREYRARGTLVWQPSANFDANLKVNFDRDHQVGSGPAASYETVYCPLGYPQSPTYKPGNNYECSAGQNYVVGNLPPAMVALQPEFGPHFSAAPFMTTQLLLTSLTANYHPVHDITITSVTGYFRNTSLFSDNFSEGGDGADIASVQNTDYRQFSQELRATSSFQDPLNFMVGGFFSHIDIIAPVVVAFGPPISDPPIIGDDAAYRDTKDNYSLFGQAIYDFDQEWELTAGARWTHNYNSQAGSMRGPSAESGFTTVPLTFKYEELEFNNLSPEVTLSYKPTSDLTLYGTYRQGYEAGGFNETAYNVVGSDDSFKPETVQGGEVGAKGVGLDHQLQFTSAAYYYSYKALQLSSYDSAYNEFTIQNAGAATIYGLELSGVYAPNMWDGLSFRGSGNYNHARYDVFPATCYPGQTISEGCNVDPVGGQYQAQSLAGKQLLFAPTWTGDIGTTYETPFMESLHFSGSVDATYSSGYYAMLEEAPGSYQSAFWKLNANVTVSGDDDNWEVSLIGTNLTNQLTYSIVQGSSATGSASGYATGQLSDLAGQIQPWRSVMLRVTLRDGLLHQ
jgi:iron complex outermembrane recepter protein